MTAKNSSAETSVYHSPLVFVGSFYLILAGWIVFCLTYLEAVFNRLELSVMFGFVMVTFIIIITCYFSLGISYQIKVGANGSIRLTSFRRTIDTCAEDIHIIEGPHLPVGFIRFRLDREKAYLFYIANNTAIETVLKKIRRANPDINFKHLKISS